MQYLSVKISIKNNKLGAFLAALKNEKTPGNKGIIRIKLK